MDKPPRKPAMDAAHDILIIAFRLGGSSGKDWLEFTLARAADDAYTAEVKKMVDAELPFWELLDELPPLRPPKEKPDGDVTG